METNVLNPIPDKEFERILELSDLNLDYTSLEDEFADLTKLAAKVAGTDISLINLIDSFTQWSVANYGFSKGQTPREETVCQYTIMDNNPMEVSNLHRDKRFDDREFVKENPEITYYFGVPLTTENGNNIGVLCVLDEERKHLTPEKIEMLKIISHEIVDRLVAYKKVDELRKALHSADESKRKLSHDIRGPLGGIIGLADIIEGQSKEQRIEEIIELAEMIKKGGQSILELADSILSEKMNKGEQRLKDHEFNLITLKEKLAELYNPQAASKEIDLTIVNHSKDEDIPFAKDKILQILGNLISNAIKFTPKGGMVMVRQELKRAKESGSKVLFTIKDTGNGISEEKIEEIKKGDAKSSNGTDGEKGYGFGLSLVKHLIDKMNGTMEITSTRGEGCTFNITLPIERS